VKRDTVGRRDPRSAVLDAALVRAALWRGDDAVRAWAQRPDDFDLDEIWNPGRHCLLGQIGVNLSAAGCDDAEVPRLAGIARKQWVEHQLTGRRLAPLADALDRADIDVWLVGGGAIGRAAWGYGGELAARFAGDTRLVVGRAAAVEAISVLAEHGARFPEPVRTERRVEWYTSVGFQLADETWTELHWGPSKYVDLPIERTDPGEFVELGGVSVGTLSPELTLVMVCVDSVLSTEYRGLAWLVDVDRLVSGGCNLGRAADLAEASGFADVVKRRLSVYRAARELGSDVGWLDECPVTSSVGDRLRADLQSFCPGRSRAVRLAGAGEFLADRWMLDSARQVPGAAARRVRLRTGRRLGRH